MKKCFIGLYVLFIFIFCSDLVAFSSNNITVNGKTFELKYSNCTPTSKSCLNEYYLSDEYGNKWSELITFVYVPNFNKPHAFAQSIKNSQKYSTWLEQNEDYDIVTFFIPFNYAGKNLVENNVAKITYSNDRTGSISIQYAKRYFNDIQNMEELQNKLYKSSLQYKTILNLIPVQDLYMQPLQKW